MSLHLQRDLEGLKKQILQLGNLVEGVISNALQALVSREPQLAAKAMQEEDEINNTEVLIETECLKILALHQPVAVDLRFIVVVLKVNNDLERMADIAQNIAARAIDLAMFPEVPLLQEITQDLPEAVRSMVRKSLDALVSLDLDQAREVVAMDDQVDEINRRMFDQVQVMIEKNVKHTAAAMNILSSSRYMERIADLATNIAEDVIFMVEGRVVRHHD
jgi:phosphate transport system protein